MKEYAKEYPHYAFEKNAGYGTALHIKGIEEHGLCPIHRRSFTKKWQ
jgi:ribonuclease HII